MESYKITVDILLNKVQCELLAAFKQQLEKNLSVDLFVPSIVTSSDGNAYGLVRGLQQHINCIQKFICHHSHETKINSQHVKVFENSRAEDSSFKEYIESQWNQLDLNKDNRFFLQDAALKKNITSCKENNASPIIFDDLEYNIGHEAEVDNLFVEAGDISLSDLELSFNEFIGEESQCISPKNYSVEKIKSELKSNFARKHYGMKKRILMNKLIEEELQCIYLKNRKVKRKSSELKSSMKKHYEIKRKTAKNTKKKRKLDTSSQFHDDGVSLSISNSSCLESFSENIATESQSNVSPIKKKILNPIHGKNQGNIEVTTLEDNLESERPLTSQCLCQKTIEVITLDDDLEIKNQLISHCHCQRNIEVITLEDDLDIERPLASRYLRPIVIDGSNIAFAHGKPTGKFSCKGIKIAVQYFLERGHPQVTAFVPQFRRSRSKKSNATDVAILEQLSKTQNIVFTPSRKIMKKCISSYDDRFIVQLACINGGVILSNDNYRDLAKENKSFRETIQSRLLMYCFVGDILMIPSDPMGADGPSLEEYLSFPPGHIPPVH